MTLSPFTRLDDLSYELKKYTITPIAYAPIAQSVERIHGKDEVTGSNPVWGSKK